MAGIRTSIEITDRITAPLTHITNALNMTVSAFDSVNEHAHIDADFVSIREEIASATLGLDEFSASVEDTAAAQEHVNQSAQQGTAAFGNLAGSVMGLIGSYISFQAITSTISHAIDYASDLVEVQNVVDVTFQNSAGKINDWSQTTLNAFGLSELAAKQYAGTMGSMLKSMQVTGAAVDEMSINLTQLAGDLASFYNLDTDVAFEKIRSGISGETEPLKQLGINMSVANLEAYALSQGIKTSYSDMDTASQALLRYNYLLSVTADAQGDFSRTQDSYANQVRLLQGSWEAFTGSLATNVIPMLTFIVSTLNGGIAFLSDNISVVEPLLMGLLTILGLYTAALITLTVVKGALSAVEAVHTALTGAWSIATFTATVAQQGLNAALLACPITWIIVLIIALIAIIIAVAQHIANTSNVATSAFGVITGGVNVVIQGFKNLLTAIGIVCQNMAIAFKNSIANVQASFWDLLATATSVIASIADKLSRLPFVNFDASGLTAASDEYAAKAEAARAKIQDYKDVGAAFKSGWVQDAFKSGAAWGDNVTNKVSDKLSSFTAVASGGGVGNSNDLYSTGNAGFDQIRSGVDDAAGSAGKTASNTSKMVDVSDEQIKYLRDIAEQEVINRFTTAEINVNMTNNNNVSSSMDLDGMVSDLTEGVREAMEAAAQGV